MGALCSCRLSISAGIVLCRSPGPLRCVIAACASHVLRPCCLYCLQSVRHVKYDVELTGDDLKGLVEQYKVGGQLSGAEAACFGHLERVFLWPGGLQHL